MTPDEHAVGRLGAASRHPDHGIARVLGEVEGDHFPCGELGGERVVDILGVGVRQGLGIRYEIGRDHARLAPPVEGTLLAVARLPREDATVEKDTPEFARRERHLGARRRGLGGVDRRAGSGRILGDDGRARLVEKLDGRGRAVLGMGKREQREEQGHSHAPWRAHGSPAPSW